MALQRLNVQTRNILRKFGFTFPPTQGDNALATLKDVNYVIDCINNLFPYRMYDFGITQTGTDNPVLTKLASGASECPNSCTSDCVLCDCRTSCNNEKAGAFSAAVTRTGVGTYRLVVSGDFLGGATIQNVGLFFRPFPTVTTRVTVTKISSTTYEIGTYTNTVAADGLLDTVVVMKVYY